MGRLNSRWTKDEELIAVQAMRKYGKDFQAIAEVLGNKSEAHVKTFYANNERRYNLKDMLKQYADEHREEWAQDEQDIGESDEEKVIEANGQQDANGHGDLNGDVTPAKKQRLDN